MQHYPHQHKNITETLRFEELLSIRVRLDAFMLVMPFWDILGIIFNPENFPKNYAQKQDKPIQPNLCKKHVQTVHPLCSRPRRKTAAIPFKLLKLLLGGGGVLNQYLIFVFFFFFMNQVYFPEPE